MSDIFAALQRNALGGGAGLSERIIKKYENRRLYDTVESRYVNLDAVQELVLEGHDVKVVDAKSGEDLTRHVLTQIIVEGSKDPDAGPPVEFLRDLIRSTDRANKDFLQWYLGTAQGVYNKIQDSLRARPARSAKENGSSRSLMPPSSRATTGSTGARLEGWPETDSDGDDPRWSSRPWRSATGAPSPRPRSPISISWPGRPPFGPGSWSCPSFLPAPPA